MGESNFDLTRLNEKDFDWIKIKKIAKCLWGVLRREAIVLWNIE